jgi:hypothetical protein
LKLLGAKSGTSAKFSLAACFYCRELMNTRHCSPLQNDIFTELLLNCPPFWKQLSSASLLPKFPAELAKQEREGAFILPASRNKV